MRHRALTTMGVSLVAAFATIAGVASAASAHTFKATQYPVEVEAKSLNDQGFQITGAVSVCKKAKFIGTATAESETLEVHPTYTECTVELAGTHTATVNTKECNYVFHAAEPGTYEGTVDIVCKNAGEEIEVVVSGITGCTIKIPGGQTGLTSVEYINEAESPTSVHVNANVTGIAWSTTSGCGLATSSGTNGEYREGKLNAKGEPELGSGPAEALAKGFVPKSSTKVGISVQ